MSPRPPRPKTARLRNRPAVNFGAIGGVIGHEMGHWFDDQGSRSDANGVRGPHSPPRYRVNGVVRNMDAWYEAFGVSEEHELYLPPEERVNIW